MTTTYYALITVANGVMALNSGVLCSALASLTGWYSCLMFAALQKMSSAREGCDIVSSSSFSVILVI